MLNLSLMISYTLDPTSTLEQCFLVNSLAWNSDLWVGLAQEIRSKITRHIISYLTSPAPATPPADHLCWECWWPGWRGGRPQTHHWQWSVCLLTSAQLSQLECCSEHRPPLSMLLHHSSLPPAHTPTHQTHSSSLDLCSISWLASLPYQCLTSPIINIWWCC